MSIAAWRSPDRGRAHRSLLVATSPVRDLLFRAKNLFIAAKVATEQRLIALRRTLARPQKWEPPVHCPGGTPARTPPSKGTTCNPGPIAGAIGASEQMFGVFEQMFGANQQIPDAG